MGTMLPVQHQHTIIFLPSLCHKHQTVFLIPHSLAFLSIPNVLGTATTWTTWNHHYYPYFFIFLLYYHHVLYYFYFPDIPHCLTVLYCISARRDRWTVV